MIVDVLVGAAVAALLWWLLCLWAAPKVFPPAPLPYRHGQPEGMRHTPPRVEACRREGCCGYEVNGLCTRADTHRPPDQHPGPGGAYR